MVMPAGILEPVIELIKFFGAVVNFESKMDSMYFMLQVQNIHSDFFYRGKT